MDWSVRNGTEADAGAVLALWRAAESPRSPTDNEAGVRLLLRRDPEALLLAEGDGEVVGALIAAWDGWRGNLYRLAVDPEWRRQGIGRDLVRRGEERLRGLGALRVTALVPTPTARRSGSGGRSATNANPAPAASSACWRNARQPC